MVSCRADARKPPVYTFSATQMYGIRFESGVDDGKASDQVGLFLRILESFVIATAQRYEG
jgi:hypothetical protein